MSGAWWALICAGLWTLGMIYFDTFSLSSSSTLTRMLSFSMGWR